MRHSLLQVRCKLTIADFVNKFEFQAQYPAYAFETTPTHCKHTRQPLGIELRCPRSDSNNQRREIQNFKKCTEIWSKSQSGTGLGHFWIFESVYPSDLEFGSV